MPVRVRGVGPETGGVMLIIAGAAFTLERFTSIENVWQWLPLFLIYLAVRDLRGRPSEQARTTVPLLFGIWLQICAIDFFGFDFLNGWPLLVVLVGLGLVIDGLISGEHAGQRMRHGDGP